MVETLCNKRCGTCKTFRSYYEEYDYDKKEPTWCGRCLNDLRENDDDYVEEDEVCHLWVTLHKKNLS